jgi:uncharacterized protein YjcR
MTKNEEAYKALLEQFTKSCLAEMVGISRQAIQKWKTVPGTRVQQLAEATGWPADKLRPEPYAED